MSLRTRSCDKRKKRDGALGSIPHAMAAIYLTITLRAPPRSPRYFLRFRCGRHGQAARQHLPALSLHLLEGSQAGFPCLFHDTLHPPCLRRSARQAKGQAFLAYPRADKTESTACSRSFHASSQAFLASSRLSSVASSSSSTRRLKSANRWRT